MANKTPFIDKSTASEAYEESKRFMRVYFEPIDEFDRIAKGRPRNDIPKNMPKVVDGTTASIINDDPKRIIQQTPTGLVECKDYPEYAKIADIELRERLIPMSKRNGSFLQKSWNMVSKAGTWGRVTSYSFFTEYNGTMTVDWTIPYVKDILDERGKVFAGDNHIRFMRSWYQKRDLKAIINREMMFMEKDKKYKSDWDLKLLAEFMETGATAKPADLQTPAEKEKGGDTGGYEVIHAFQVGVEAEFYSFAPRHKPDQMLRVKANKDPRGAMPLDDMYSTIDLSNPLGYGRVEASAGIQNLIDQQMQMFQFMSTLMQAPPVIAYGSVDKNKLPMRPYAVWDGGQSRQNGGIEPLKIDNTQIASFSNNYGLLKSQVLQRNQSAQGAAISSEAGNPSFSKTQAGVEAQQSQLSLSDNYIRKQYEEWFEALAETGINILFSEMTGSPTRTLEPNDVKDIMKTPAAQYVEGNVLTIPYQKIKDVTFHFEVNPSSSEVKENSENVDKLIQTIELAGKVPSPEIAEKIPGLFKVITKEIGAEGIDELFPEDELGPDGQPVAAQPQQPAVTPEMVQQMVAEGIQQAMEAQKQETDSDEERLIKSLNIKFPDLPEDTKRQVLALLDLDANDAFPSEKEHDLKTLDALSKADEQEHRKGMDVSNQDMTREQNAQQAEQAMAATEAKTATATKQKPQPAPSSAPTQALDPEDETLVAELTNRGYDENDIQQAIVMLQQGKSADEVIAVLAAK